jgi:hypothetical protein
MRGKNNFAPCQIRDRAREFHASRAMTSTRPLSRANMCVRIEIGTQNSSRFHLITTMEGFLF